MHQRMLTLHWVRMRSLRMPLLSLLPQLQHQEEVEVVVSSLAFFLRDTCSGRRYLTFTMKITKSY